MYVEIPVTDLERAERFYTQVFSCPASHHRVDGHDAVLLFTGEEQPDTGALVALMSGESYVPSLDGTRVYFAVEDVPQTLDRAIRLGGQELYPPTEVGDQVVAEFSDTEGNRIAVSSRTG